MKKKSFKMLLHWLISTTISFAIIYLFVFCGGWRLLESGDIILLEVVAAIGVGFIFFVMYEITRSLEEKLRELEDRISALEDKN